MSNKNRKVYQMVTSKPVEQMTELEQQKWLNEHPTRGEVTQFVDGYINNEVLPIIMNAVGKDLFHLKCRNEVLLKFLVDKDVCTPQEFEESYNAYLKQKANEAMKRQEQLRKEQELNTSRIIVPDKTIVH